MNLTLQWTTALIASRTGTRLRGDRGEGVISTAIATCL